MEYTVGQKIQGFVIDSIQPIKEIDANMIRLTHEKTKGEMVFLQRDDSNMTFSVTMKTLPKDDTGIFHILEHSTLGGSKKYPVKEPFVELLKSSMNTFLNAMTFPDKTMYPVSSQTPKDFLNLVQVYLDAVFAPSVIERKEIFLQEGWHYELLNKDDAPTFKGVVFNEMKGAYTSADTFIENGMNKLLFADNCYQYDSGGYPASIPELTYESFLEQHHKYYSMSNAHFFLDGNVPLEEVLALIEEYAKNEEYIEVDATINSQEEKTGLFNKIEYPIDENEDASNKAMISFGKIACNFDEKEKIYAYKILCNYLASSNDTPIKKAILEKGLAEDLSLDIYDGIKQPWLILTARNTKEENLEQIKETILEVLQKELKQGLNHKIIEASLSFLEFKTKERGNSSYPEGLGLNINVLDSWLYGGDPALFLQLDGTFKFLREQLEKGYFEALIQDFLDHKEYTATLIASPSKTLTKEMEEQEKAKLEAIASTWDDAYREELVKENKELLAWQQSVDTPEQLATMPKLTLDDINKEIEIYKKEVTTYKDVPVLKYQFSTNGITYLHLFFSLKDVKQEDLPYISLYCSLLGELPTENYDVIELQTELKAKFGAISTTMATFDLEGDTAHCKPYIALKCSFLDVNQEAALELIQEIIFRTQFTQKKIKDLFKQMETALQQSVMMSGHSFGAKHIQAAHSARGVLSEMTSGYTFYQFLKKFNKEFDERIEGAIQYFEGISSLYHTGNLTVTYNGESNLQQFIDALPAGNRGDETVAYTLFDPTSETITVPTQVSYASLGGNAFENNPLEFVKMKVLSKIVSLEYLWNEIRVKGGAYGCGLQVTLTGDIIFYSYRDPSAMKSLDIYRNTTQFMEEYLKDKDQVDKFIISTLSDQAVLSIAGKLAGLDHHYFCNVSDEQLQANRYALIHTTVEELKESLATLQKIIDQNHTCVIGNIK